MTKLWSHQEEAAARLVGMMTKHGGAMAALGMGCGKTLVALEVARRLNVRTMLVCAPLSVVPVWAYQVKTHRPGEWDVTTATGSTRTKMKVIASALERLDVTHHNSIIVTNYESLDAPQLYQTLLRPWDLVVWDESHRIKAPMGKRSQRAALVAERARYRLALTGTPMPHSPLDVWGQFRAIDKGLLGPSWYGFRARFAVTQQQITRQSCPKCGATGCSACEWTGRRFVETICGFRNLDVLGKLLDARTVRQDTLDVISLPPTMDVNVRVELGNKARRAYRELYATLSAEIAEGRIQASNGAVRLLRLQQLTSGFAMVDNEPVTIDTAKADALRDLLEDMSSSWVDETHNEPVVVFALFRRDLDVIDAIARECGRTVGRIEGGRNDYQAWLAGDIDTLAVQIQAGGLGIDLTRARYAIYYSVSWSLGDYQQSRARLHRPGQQRNVTYYHLIAEGTTDEVVRDTLERKGDVVASVMEHLTTTRGL